MSGAETALVKPTASSPMGMRTAYAGETDMVTRERAWDMRAAGAVEMNMFGASALYMSPTMETGEYYDVSTTKCAVDNVTETGEENINLGAACSELFVTPVNIAPVMVRTRLAMINPVTGFFDTTVMCVPFGVDDIFWGHHNQGEGDNVMDPESFFDGGVFRDKEQSLNRETKVESTPEIVDNAEFDTEIEQFKQAMIEINVVPKGELETVRLHHKGGVSAGPQVEACTLRISGVSYQE
jgi:hypothetical protein